MGRRRLWMTPNMHNTNVSILSFSGKTQFFMKYAQEETVTQIFLESDQVFSFNCKKLSLAKKQFLFKITKQVVHNASFQYEKMT